MLPTVTHFMCLSLCAMLKHAAVYLSNLHKLKPEAESVWKRRSLKGGCCVCVCVCVCVCTHMHICIFYVC